MALIKQQKSAKLKDKDTYQFLQKIKVFGITVYSYEFESTNLEDVRAYKNINEIGFAK